MKLRDFGAVIGLAAAVLIAGSALGAQTPLSSETLALDQVKTQLEQAIEVGALSEGMRDLYFTRLQQNADSLAEVLAGDPAESVRKDGRQAVLALLRDSGAIRSKLTADSLDEIVTVSIRWLEVRAGLGRSLSSSTLGR